MKTVHQLSIARNVAAGSVLLWWLGVAACPAQSTPDYDRDVQPILADLCFACHGADSAAREADLRLDQRDAAIESGAIVEGQPDESSLIERIETADPDLIMPPPKTKKSLTAAQKELLRRWVASGAVYQPHWSFSVPVQPALPAVREESWLKNPIDRFVLARLETHGLQPAPPADARTLFRRLHLDITGLPPAPDDVQRFESDYQQQPEAALSDWIDRLMKTPAWGEHRARYWLDAARYGDTHGLHFDNYREMWVYRDWVIRAFNRNQPFDQFVIEQLAGDLLSQPTEEQLIATGFQRCNITTNEGGTIDEENLANYAADRVQTFGWVFLGLTTNCGQCHDHKFDPFSMRDYYSLAAFFRNTTQGAKDGNVADGLGPVIVVPGEADQARWHALPDEIAAAISSRDARREQARGEFDTWLQSATPESIGQDVPTDQLVLHLPLNEGQGNEVRGLGLAEPVRSPGELGWDKDGRSGPAPIIKPGSTLDLGGAGDFERDQAFSYAAWVKPAAANTQAAILARMDEKAGHRGWDLWQNGQAFGAHLIDSWPANGMKVVTRDNVVKPGQWQHVLVSYDGSGKPEGVKIYIDGNEAATRVENNTLQAAASIRTSTPLRIGQRSEGAVFDGGAVQDVRLYGRQLSGREAQAIAQHAALLNLLVVAADKRTPEQNQQLYDHYLGARDAQYPALAAAVTALEGEREAIRARSPVTHIQRERPDAPAMANILMRGAYDKPGEQVPAATPEALHPLPEGAAANRLGLAQWVVDPHNPLTARVTVNRFWQEVFGQGIVVTAEDFGTMGSAPSHPELLDWLAVEFQNSGWDVRQLFQLILTSATYRQAAIATPEKLEKDRDNTLLSRGPRFRMDAEMVRDGALSASGLLSAKMYGPGTRPYQPEGIWDIVGLPGGNTRDYVQDQGENLYRRTLYTFWKRMAPPPSLETFNAPSREVCVVRRERTNTPLQALVTLNDPQFMEAARHLAQQAILQCPDDFNERLRFVSLRLLARELNPAEQQIARASFDDLAAHYGSHPEHAGQLIHYGDSPPSGQVDAQTLAAWTMLVNQLMNLDETLNK